MRNLLIIGLLIVTLIVGVLAINSLRTESVDGTKKIESIDRAKEARDAAEKAGQKIKDAARETGDRF
ncbi:MAG: hypothetical protein KGY61_13330 [Desulfobacterales bacterium]|nr:hypothetical protein [Desulfobacterales bacterium]